MRKRPRKLIITITIVITTFALTPFCYYYYFIAIITNSLPSLRPGTWSGVSLIRHTSGPIRIICAVNLCVYNHPRTSCGCINYNIWRTSVSRIFPLTADSLLSTKLGVQLFRTGKLIYSKQGLIDVL